MTLLMIACRCTACSTLLEHPLEEFYLDLDGAIEQAKKNNSRRIPLMCPKCSEQLLYGHERTA